MDHDQLDALLGEQQSIEDNQFSQIVMKKLPNKQFERRRSFILVLSAILGSLASFVFLYGSTDQLFTEMFQGLTKYNHLGLFMIMGVLSIYAVIFQISQDEL